MKELVRTIAAGAAGAVIASVVITGAPALADQVAKAAPKNSVTSKSIKNGQVKPADLSAKVKASLAKADTALQDIADGSVGSAEVAADSLTAVDLAANSVGNSELANGSVDGSIVEDNSLSLNDYAFADGFESVAVPALAAGACTNLSMDTDVTSLGGLLVVTPSILAADGLMVEGAAYGTPVDVIDFRVCNRGGGAFAGASVSFIWGTLV